MITPRLVWCCRGAVVWLKCGRLSAGVNMDTSVVVVIALTLLGAATAQKSAYCRIEPNSGTGAVEGSIEFTQQSASSNITITVNLTGFEVSSQSSNHGFHVHEHGELGSSCSDAGAHYNPTGKTHGGPHDENRHVGDLGNIVVTNGNVETTITDHVVTLYGSQSVIDRSIVVHADEDDLGLGGHVDSNTTGHAGARLGCCKITHNNPSLAASVVYSTLLVMASCLLSALV